MYGGSICDEFFSKVAWRYGHYLRNSVVLHSWGRFHALGVVLWVLFLAQDVSSFAFSKYEQSECCFNHLSCRR
jgi:hypothetical protein